MSLAVDVPKLTYSDRFALKESDYASQYCGLYFCRLEILKDALKQAAADQWPKTHCCKQIRDLQADRECVIIGTIYVALKLKPSALSTYTEDLFIEDEIKVFDHGTGNPVILEDESGRVVLKLELSDGTEDARVAKKDGTEKNGDAATFPSLLKRSSSLIAVTGITVGARGNFSGKGVFTVKEFVLPPVPLIEPIASQPCAAEGPKGASGQRGVLFVHHLAIGTPSEDGRATQRLIDVCGGELPNLNVTKIVIVGDSMPNADVNMSLPAVAAADHLFATLASCTTVGLMPGASDPVSFTVPQPAINGAFMPRSRRYKSFVRLTNPAEFAVDDCRLVGSSGQLIDDLLLYSNISDPLDALQLTVESRCLAPTAPDTLSCFPFSSKDPFVLNQGPNSFPHFVFSAYPSKFRSSHQQRRPALAQRRLANGTQIFLVPSFSATRCAVFLNLATQRVALLDLR